MQEVKFEFILGVTKIPTFFIQESPFLSAISIFFNQNLHIFVFQKLGEPFQKSRFFKFFGGLPNLYTTT